MSKVVRTLGVEPGSTRNADNITTIINNIRAVLGADVWTSMGGAGAFGAQVGDIERENFSDFAGIQETKVLFEDGHIAVPTGHSHTTAANDGAEIAHGSITELQLHWWSSLYPPGYVKSVTKGTILRFGYWDASKLWSAGNHRVTPYTGGYDPNLSEETEPEPWDHRIYYSTGHAYFRETTRTAEDAGTPFPPNSSPAVVFTPVAEFDTAGPTGLAVDIKNANTGWGVNAIDKLSIALMLTTHEYFDIRIHIPSDDDNKFNFVESFAGLYWIAMYDPSIEDPFSIAGG
jgi:hypothetical protein